jgi:hypothetical protein
MLHLRAQDVAVQRKPANRQPPTRQPPTANPPTANRQPPVLVPVAGYWLPVAGCWLPPARQPARPRWCRLGVGWLTGAHVDSGDFP